MLNDVACFVSQMNKPRVFHAISLGISWWWVGHDSFTADILTGPVAHLVGVSGARLEDDREDGDGGGLSARGDSGVSTAGNEVKFCKSPAKQRVSHYLVTTLRCCRALERRWQLRRLGRGWFTSGSQISGFCLGAAGSGSGSGGGSGGTEPRSSVATDSCAPADCLNNLGGRAQLVAQLVAQLAGP